MNAPNLLETVIPGYSGILCNINILMSRQQVPTSKMNKNKSAVINNNVCKFMKLVLE